MAARPSPDATSGASILGNAVANATDKTVITLWGHIDISQKRWINIREKSVLLVVHPIDIILLLNPLKTR